MDKKLYPRIGEEVIWETLDNGLPVCIVPKKGFTRKYALFATLSLIHISEPTRP